MTFYSLLIPDYASILLPFLSATEINSLLLTAKQVKVCFGKQGTKVEMERWKQKFPNFDPYFLTYPEKVYICTIKILVSSEENIPCIYLKTAYDELSEMSAHWAINSVCCYMLGLTAIDTFDAITNPFVVSTENEAGLYIRRANFYINHFPDYTSYMKITPATVVWYNKRE